MNGANERGSTIDVARDKSSGAERDCERYERDCDERIRKIQYNVSLCSFFFFFFFVPTFDSRLKERVRLSLTKFYIDISAVRKFSRGIRFVEANRELAISRDRGF